MKSYEVDNEVISFSALFKVFWRWKWVIILVTGLAAVGSVFYAVNQVDVYRAKLIAITPSEQGGGMSGISGQLGGLASLAGVSLGGSGAKNLEQVEDLLRSRSFLQGVIEKHELKPDLIAAIGWDKTSNQVIYDPEIYDADSGQWVRTPPPGKTVEPSAWEAHPQFLTRIKTQVFLKKDMLRLSVDHYSPYVAKTLADILLEEINVKFRERTKQEAQDSIAYLREVIATTKIAQVKSVFYGLLEEQIKNDMLAEVRKEFAFETLTPAVIAEDKEYPKRGLICILGTLLGGALSLVLALVCNAVFPLRKK